MTKPDCDRSKRIVVIQSISDNTSYEFFGTLVSIDSKAMTLKTIKLSVPEKTPQTWVCK